MTVVENGSKVMVAKIHQQRQARDGKMVLVQSRQVPEPCLVR
jgi:hypothetical protein